MKSKLTRNPFSQQVFSLKPVSLLLIFLLVLPVNGCAKAKKRKISGAYKALNFWVDQRAYPNEFIPSGHFEGFVHSAENLDNGQGRYERLPQWESMGPYNIGGRTLSLAFNPQDSNTLYAGSASGGLWRSRTAGIGAEAWQYLPTGFPVLGVSSIAIAPSDSNIIYIGTGEVYSYQNAQGSVVLRATRGSYGIGILKSENAGLTWEKSLDWSYFQERAVQAVRINPLNQNTIWAATTEGTYKSIDAGESWTIVNSTIMAMDLVINPEDTNTVYIACGNFGSTGRGIYRTENGGASWSQLSNGLPGAFLGKAQLAIHAANPEILYASIGNGFTSYNGATWLCRTENGGDSWEVVSTEDYSRWQGWYSHFVGVHPYDDLAVLTGGINIWRSTDGGYNLEVQSVWEAWYLGLTQPGEPEGPPEYAHADHHTMIYHPDNPDIVYFGTDGGVFRSLDGGQTFEGCNGGFQTQQFYPGFSSSIENPDLAMGGMQDNATAIYQGTDAWNRVIGGDGSFTAINQTSNNILFGSYQYLAMQRSINSGASWYQVSPPQNGEACFIAPFILCPSNQSIVYAGRSYVFRSGNNGSNWQILNDAQPLDGNPILSIAVGNQTCGTVYATTAPVHSRARIFRSFDSGTNWDEITQDLPDRYPMDIIVGPQGDEYLYLVFSGFGTSHVVKSEDAGDQWIDIGQGLPDVPTSAVFVDPQFPDHIYVGNDLGVYVSLDGGLDWAAHNSGLPDAVLVMDLSYSPANNSLRVVTHGNGVYESSLIIPDDVIPGDLDQNGVVNVLDIIQMVGIILGDLDENDYFQITIDLNSDGYINIQDIILIINIILDI